MENPTILCTIPLAIIGGLLIILISCLRLAGLISQNERDRGLDD